MNGTENNNIYLRNVGQSLRFEKKKGTLKNISHVEKTIK